VWVAVGGNPESVVRAAQYGLPMALAIIGGAPERFAPLVALYREALGHAGHDRDATPVSINSHGYVATTSQHAADDFYPAYAEVMTRIGRERGWGPMTRLQYDALLGPKGAIVAGSPEQVAEKIVAQHALFGHQRFVMQTSLGSMPHDRVLASIELLGTVVAPMVRDALTPTSA